MYDGEIVGATFAQAGFDRLDVIGGFPLSEVHSVVRLYQLIARVKVVL